MARLLRCSRVPRSPANLDEFVVVAIERNPAAQALGYEADTARSSAVAAGRPMPPQLMVGVDALGAPNGSLAVSRAEE